MTPPADTPAEWIERLLAVVGAERADRLSGMSPGEKDVVLLRLLANHERATESARRLLERVDQALDQLATAGNGLAETLGLPAPTPSKGNN